MRLINHLLFMDDLKLYGRSEEELESSMLFGTQGCRFELDNCAVGVEAGGKGSL